MRRKYKYKVGQRLFIDWPNIEYSSNGYILSNNYTGILESDYEYFPSYELESTHKKMCTVGRKEDGFYRVTIDGARSWETMRLIPETALHPITPDMLFFSEANEYARCKRIN